MQREGVCRPCRVTSRLVTECARHAIEARVYAEDSFGGFLPQAGRAGHVRWPDAGDGTGEHPTQCLLDLYSLRRVYGEFEGLRVAIVGDVLRSRVARSDLFGFRKMGIEVSLVGPPTLMPPGIEYWGAPIHHDLDALEDVDVIYLLRMQLERAKGKVPPVPSLREYSRVWGLSPYRVKAGQRVMHPGPINRGVELSADLADDGRSLILHQVESGLAVRMAILYQCLAGSLSEEPTG